MGEYNPESVLEDLSSVPDTSPLGRPALDSCATHAKPARALARHPDEEAAFIAQRSQRQRSWYKSYRRRPGQPELSESHRSHLAEAGAFIQLPRDTADALLAIYLSLLDDIIPVLDGAAVVRQHSNGQASRYLVIAMCLVACKSRQAAPHLRLDDDGPVVRPLQFASRLLAGLDAAIKSDLEPDRLVRTQILALMHLHNDGLLGRQRSSAYIAQAICEAWFLSLQWDIPGNPDQGQCDYLWWTLRGLDRLNKPVMGAMPFVIDDIDTAIRRIAPSEDSYRSRVMHASLALGDLTSRATRVYKASSTDTEDDGAEFPSLQEVTSGVDFDRFHRCHRGMLPRTCHSASIWLC